MITLYTFGRYYGLPDPSPFVTKTEVHLKMAGLPYRLDTKGFNKAPKGKLPYIDDGGTIVADSSFIRLHLEKRHGIDFDKGLSAEQKAGLWAAEKMCEDHLYWALMHSRWIETENFNKGPKRYFDLFPAPVRPFIAAMVRRQVGKALKANGLGRHRPEEIYALAERDIDALAALLGARPWFGGEAPRGADATLWAFVSNLLCPHFDAPIRTSTERHANLRAYARRGFERWFPDLRSAGQA